VGLTEERQQVVHAKRVKWDVAHQDELVVAARVGERGRGEPAGRDKLGERGGDASRGPEQIGGVAIGAEGAN